METPVRQMEILRAFRDGTCRPWTDELLEEVPLTLEVDGLEEAQVILTRGNEELWALGNLACRRRILSREDVEDLSLEPGRVRVTRRTPREGIPPLARRLHTAATRLVDPKDLEAARLGPLKVRWSLPFASLEGAVTQLAEGPLFRKTGSVHVAVLVSTTTSRRFLVEDVGRHNAVDKAVGWALKEGLEPEDCFLAVSGRLPADMVYKAQGARIPLLASVSAATAAGVDAARRGGITLVGFAREGRMNVYAWPERIEGLTEPGAIGTPGTAPAAEGC